MTTVPEQQNVSPTSTTNSNLDSFEELMKERARLRKEREDHNVGELRVRIQKLESALVGECKRRKETEKNLERVCCTYVQKLQQSLEKSLHRHESKLSTQLDELEEQLLLLEDELSTITSSQQETIHTRSNQIQEQLQSLSESFHTERKNRIMREGQLYQQLTQLSQQLSTELSLERTTRTTELLSLQTTITNSQQVNQKQHIQWQQQVNAELALLQEELATEQSERTSSEQTIIGALNEFTQQIQNSLTILNGEE